ncbi:uncharacterized protein LOC143927220 isoform X2 [Lithobates pipiens]
MEYRQEVMSGTDRKFQVRGELGSRGDVAGSGRRQVQNRFKDLEDTDGAIYDETSRKTKFSLCLLTKVSPLEDLDVETEKAKISSIKLALELMVKQPKTKILESPLMPAQEKIGSKTSTSTEHAKKKKKSRSTEDDEAAKEAQIREERLEILGKAGYFTKAVNEQKFFNLPKKSKTNISYVPKEIQR